jgi:hypothetical protein
MTEGKTEEKIVEILQVIVPGETHFVVNSSTMWGVLSFWAVAKFSNGKEEYVMDFPVIQSGDIGIQTYASLFRIHNLSVIHWAELKSWIDGLSQHDRARVSQWVIDLYHSKLGRNS